jgi:hypothetical protein
VEIPGIKTTGFAHHALMRILYLTINEHVDPNKGGVSNKLISKVSAISNKVEFCKFINAIPSPENDEVKEIMLSDLIIQLEIGTNTKDDNRILFYRKIAENIAAKNWNIDRVIMRYPFASSGLLEFSEKFMKKIVFEHNTKETEEIKLHIARKRYAPFGIRPSEFRFWYKEKKLPLINEKNIGPKIFDNAFAGACITTEIAQFEHHRNPNYKTFVSGNFYNVKTSQLIAKAYTDKNQLCLGMIVTTMASWYGLDRLLSSFAKFEDNYQLVIAGIEPTNIILKDMIVRYGIHKNLVIMGKLPKDKLHEFYSKVHLCFGSLGLHAIKLNYASTLKVKESVSFGIPVALGYCEEDFHNNPEFKPYYVQLPNDESPINFDELKQFALKFYSEEKNQIRLRDLALKYLDVDVKVEQLLKNIS